MNKFKNNGFGMKNQDIFSELGIHTDSGNRHAVKHLDRILSHVQEKAPIPRSKLVSQLRIILCIQNRYVEEYIDGLIALDVIRVEKGMVYWNLNGVNNDLPILEAELLK